MAQGNAGKRGTATRARLLAAARDVVAEVGYAHATTKAIAAAAGVAEGTIYRHFPDKHALFLAAVVDANQPVITWMSALPERAGHATLASNLSETLTRLASLRQHMLPLELAMLTDPELAARRQAGIAALRTSDLATAVAGLPEPNPPALLARYLSAEQALGRVRPDVDPIRAAVTILATLMGLTIMPAQDPPLDPSDDPIAAVLLDTAADILAKGLQ
jgi:AcrR family transcriptional regulator